MGKGCGEFVVTCMKIWHSSPLPFFFFLTVAGQLQNVLFKELIASWVELGAESCLITYLPTSWH